MNAYMTAAAAVTRSISHDEVACVALDETLSGMDAKRAAIIEELRAQGMEDYDDDNGSIKAWGAHNGADWTVRAIDGLTQSVRYLR